MKKIVLTTVAALSALTALNAQAYCTGTGNYQSCYDSSSGNSYSVNRIGGTTYLSGSNSSTGSDWSQTTTTIGNTTYHQGRSSSGNYWNGSTTSIGDTTYTSGTDSNGNYYSKTCNSFGCY